jgi:hypothetical protein
VHTVPQQEEEDDVVILSGNPLQDEPAGLEDEDDVSPEELDDSLSGVAAEEERQWEETAEALHLPAGVTFTHMLLEDDFDFDNPAWMQGYVPPTPPRQLPPCHCLAMPLALHLQSAL